MELAAEIVILRLAETFVISRESRDEEKVLHVELAHERVVGHGEGAAIDRYEETAGSALAFVE
ncbi:MAG: dipeptide epimerase, partial [Actinobacteria bacterium]|nr:dipeptide epimerase [Actinomycetota bacterium]